MKIMAKKRARGGKTRIQYVRLVRRHDGSSGWRSAQEREVIRGCAADVMGDMGLRLDGRVSELGNRIGEMKGLC